MRPFATVPIALSIVVAVSTASALTIDNFEEGAFSLQTDGLLVEATQVGLSTTNVLSGERRVQLSRDAIASPPASVSLNLTASDDAAALFDPSGDPGHTTVSLIYEFASPVDLTAGGVLNRLVVTYAEATPTLPGAPAHSITLTSGIDSVSIQGEPGAGVILGPGAFTFLLPSATIDFTQIDTIDLTITTSSDVPSTAAVSDFAAVPEPSTAVLLGWSLLVLAARSSRL